jgi:uncharacterized protein (DUF305 family)
MMRSNAMPSAMLSSAVLRRGLLAGAAVTATLVLAGCGGDDSSGSGMDHGGMGKPTAAAASAAAFNDADVAFAQGMIPHHKQAVEMAQLADGRAADPAVGELAAKIEAAQQPEIDKLNGWLAAWGSPSAMPGMGMDHGAMPGMMSGADLGKLKAAKGAAFDKQFLTMMISHHEGAITMAQQETAQGSDAEAKALAAKIITDQQAEIVTMKQLLAEK